MPIALQNIGWKMYIINGSWDIIILLIVVSCQVYLLIFDINAVAGTVLG